MHINAISKSFMCPFSTTSEVKLNITRSMKYANISCSASNRVTKKEQLDSSVVTSTLDVSCKYQQSHKSLNHGESMQMTITRVDDSSTKPEFIVLTPQSPTKPES